MTDTPAAQDPEALDPADPADDPADDPGAFRRPFAAWLHEQRGGLLHEELGDALAEVVAAVHEYGKKGEVVLRLRFDKAASNVIEVEDTITTKVPEAPRVAVFFRDDHDNLVRNDPRQQSFTLRDAAPAARSDTPRTPRSQERNA